MFNFLLIWKYQNERYLVLTAKLLDAKAAAADAKQRGDKSAQKQATMNIRTYSQGGCRVLPYQFEISLSISGRIKN